MDVVETMILVKGLPKGGEWPVLSMAMSTDETLTAAQIVERILQQAERLTSDKALKGGELAPFTGGASTKGVAKAVSFIDGKPPQVPNTPTNKVVGNDPRAGVQWMGQQARSAYQPYNNGNNSHKYTHQPNTNQGGGGRGGGGRGGNKPNQGRGRGKGKGRGSGGRGNGDAHGNAVHAQAKEEVGWAFRVLGDTNLPSSDDETSTPPMLSLIHISEPTRPY